MGYQSLIDANLNKAFTILKDLTVDIVLTRKPNPSFDFSTVDVKFGKSETIATKGVVSDIKKTSKDRNTVEKQVLLKSKDVGDLTWYSSMQFSNKTWLIGEIPKDNGFILIANVYREE